MDGIILVDKPAGWTSHDVVAYVRKTLSRELLSASHLDAVQGSKEEQARRTKGTLSERQTLADTALRQKPAGVAGSAGQQGKAMRRLKVGHTGTLDPFATGLLILVVGSYTKKAGEFSKLDKTYKAEITLGSTSTTGDPEGKITPKSSEKPSEEHVRAVLSHFEGEISQTPHAYSAVKIDGQRAYKLAREGKTPKLEPRKVMIHSLELVAYSYPRLKIRTKVSSGTYIRSLAEDIGKVLNTGAYLSALRRTEAGNYSVEKAKYIDDVSLI